MTLYYTFKHTETCDFKTEQLKQEYVIDIPGLSSCSVDWASYYSVLTMAE